MFSNVQTTFPGTVWLNPIHVSTEEHHISDVQNTPKKYFENTK